MKIVFLDVDGVLNYVGCKHHAYGYYFVEDDKIKLLKEIIDRTEAKIVLSSSWRIERSAQYKYEKPRDYKLYHKLVKKLKEYDLLIYSHTPVLREYRGKEIDQWLKNWRGETIESFVILDDDADMQPYMDKLIQTSYETGLTREDVEKAVKMLNDYVEA